MTLPSKGEIVHSINGKIIEGDDVYRHISYSAPYLELLESLTLKESIELHSRFKGWTNDLDTESIISLLYLEKQKDQQLTEFSSRMKQRLKLALAILSDVSIVLLDEPLTNLDDKGKSWYTDIVKDYGTNKTFVVCSNHQKQEYEFCNESLTIGAI